MAANRTLRGEISAKAPYSWQTDTMTAPFVSRAINCPGANSEFLKIVGGTIGWGQIISATTSIVVATNNTAVKTFQVNVSYAAGHKYLCLYAQETTLTSNTRNTLQYYDGTSYVQQSGATNRNLSAGQYGWIFSPANSTNGGGNIGIWCHSPNVEATYDKYMLFDLTAMFGTTIADYAYSLEQQSAGSGIAWIKSYGFFTKNWYPSSQTSLESVQTSAHVVTGKNQFDVSSFTVSDIMSQHGSDYYSGLYADSTMSVVDGAINYTRQNNSTAAFFCIGRCYKDVPITVSLKSSNAIVYDIEARTKHPSEEIGSTRFYRWTNPNVATATEISHSFTPAQDGWVYFEIYSTVATLSTVISDIQLEFGSTATAYEPYTSTTYPTSPVILRGILKTDGNGNLYYYGDEYLPEGTVNRRFAEVVYDGSDDEGWALAASYNGSSYQHSFFRIQNVPNMKKYALASSAENLFSNWAEARQIADNAIDNDWTMRRANNAATLYVLSPTSDGAVTLATFKAKLALTPLHVVYDLATETTESADPYTNPITIDPNGSETFVDAGTRDFAMPVGNETSYAGLYPDLNMSPLGLKAQITLVDPFA